MIKFNVITWNSYDITKFLFYIKSKDDGCTMQNSGVMVEVESMYFSNSKDKNHVLASRAYFKVTEEILEIDYIILKIHLLKCKWIDNNISVVTDELGFVRVDLQKEA